MERKIGYERRRRPDRRSASRPGKFDRRKNTCGDCRFYQPQSEIAGVCMKHQKMIKADEFACVWFVPARINTPDDDES